MDIENLPAFAAYCERRRTNPSLGRVLMCSEDWTYGMTDAAVKRLNNPVQEGLDYALWTSLIRDRLEYDEPTIIHAGDVISRFWRLRNIFNAYFAKNAVILPAPPEL